MKEKYKYLNCIVTRLNETSFSNPLKLSEVYLINKLLRENLCVTVMLVECDFKTYKYLFG